MADPRAEALRQGLGAALAVCETELDRRNVTAVGSLAWRIAGLRRLLTVGRLPRVAAVGRRGSGKSSLANALAGVPVLGVGDVADRTVEAVWWTLTLGGRRVEWLDTPGMRAGARGSGRRAEVEAAVRATPPDVLLVLCQATEVDAGVDDDLRDAAAVADAAAEETGARPVVLGVVTKVDELAPADVTTPPFDDPEKRAHIAAAVGVFHRHLLRAGLAPRAVVPAATYVAWREAVPVHDGRWNTGVLGARVAAALPGPTPLRGDLLRADLERALRALGAEVTEAFAAMASTAGASGQWSDEADLGRLEEALATILGALGGNAETPGTPAGALIARRGRGAVDLVRGALLGIGARRASGWVAAARVRALGRALMALEFGGIDLETARALVPG